MLVDDGVVDDGVTKMCLCITTDGHTTKAVTLSHHFNVTDKSQSSSSSFSPLNLSHCTPDEDSLRVTRLIRS